MKRFYDSFGLITEEPTRELSENSLLFTVENFFLNPDNERRKTFLSAILDICNEGKGIYRQHPAKLTGHDKYMSHDQLTAIFCFSYFNKLNAHKTIWKEMVRQFFRYNNVDVPKTFKDKIFNKRFLHPRDIIFYGICNKNIFCYLLFPILFLIMFISCWSKKEVIAYGAPALKTDGKLLTFIRVRALGWKWLIKFFDFIIEKRFGGWKVIFKTYFRYEDHPNIVLLNKH